jgi:glycosyltransferase involved in cell wall biosynthesis
MSRIMGFIHDEVSRAGHEVEFFCADDVPSDWQHAVGRYFKFPWAVRRRAVAAARAHRPYDIVNVHEPSAAPIVLWNEPAGSPVVIVTSHGLERRAWNLALQEARLRRDGPALTTRVTYPIGRLWPSAVGLRRADHVFCLNLEDLEHLVGVVNRPPASVTRIFPGSDLVYAQAAEGRDYSRNTRLLFAATWRKNKGVEDLIPAFSLLARMHPKIELVILGAGVPEPLVRSHFPEALQPRIACRTPPDDRSMASAFAEADLFVLPSLFEGTPLTLIQAMMSGLPIMTTATCGMKDVIVDGVHGRLVPIRSPQAIADAVGELLGNAATRARLGMAAQQEAIARYQWNTVAEPVREVYEQLHTRRTRRP